MRRILGLILALLLLPLPASADVEIVPGSDINLVARDANIPSPSETPPSQTYKSRSSGKAPRFDLKFSNRPRL